MPNWASNECTIVGDERDLKSLYETIKGLENLSESRIDNDFDKKWLGNLVDALGGDWQKVYCRGYWTEVLYSEGQLNLFIESAWSPPTEFFDFIQKKFPSLTVLYYCEEPDLGVYVTNDKESMLYSARYVAKVCLDGEEFDEEYFDEKEDAFEWISNVADKEIHTDEEPSEIVGAYCTLQDDYNGYTDDQVVGDLGIELIIRLQNGKEIVAYRDEVIINE